MKEVLSLWQKRETERQENRMSYADKVFINMCRDIIENGTSTEGESEPV